MVSPISRHWGDGDCKSPDVAADTYLPSTAAEDFAGHHGLSRSLNRQDGPPESKVRWRELDCERTGVRACKGISRALVLGSHELGGRKR